MGVLFELVSRPTHRAVTTTVKADARQLVAARPAALAPARGHHSIARLSGVDEPVQRMALPLDDLMALGSKSKIITPEQAESARTISVALSNRVRATDEAIALPHQVATEKSAGALSTIGLTEELRIFGHGAVTSVSNGAAVRVGGHTPAALAKLIVDMGLPKAYQGEIYLSGCLTAVGPNHGFLGQFYTLIAAHCPGCVVRGNLGSAITFEDGTQAVWNATVTESAYDQRIDKFKTDQEALLANMKTQVDVAIDKAKKGTGTAQAAQDLALDFKARLTENERQWRAYIRSAYDATGSRTVTLPSGNVQAVNAINAVADGAVTSQKDIEAVLARITDTNLAAANQQLQVVQQRLQSQMAELAKKSASL